MSVLKIRDSVCIWGPFLQVDYCAITEKTTLQALRVRRCVVVENKGCYQTSCVKVIMLAQAIYMVRSFCKLLRQVCCLSKASSPHSAI